MVMIVAPATLYTLWNMIPWFIIKQKQQNSSHANPYCFAAEQWFHGIAMYVK